MPELIKKGYLYVSQPPLFKVSSDNVNIYLTNNDTLEEHSIKKGLRKTLLKLGFNISVKNNNLSNIIQDACTIKNIFKLLTVNSNYYILEQTAISGILSKTYLKKKQKKARILICKRLNRMSKEYKCIWTSCMTKDGLVFKRNMHGVIEKYFLDVKCLYSKNGCRLCNVVNRLHRIYNGSIIFIYKKKIKKIYGPINLLKLILNIGTKDTNKQRYKGLGEMNPIQLWNTSLNPRNRKLLQIKIGNTIKANSLFINLMGNVVKSRRDFIEQNALAVKDLYF